MRTVKSYNNRKTQLYKIICKINNWVYWGITYTNGKTYLDRFEEHINGRGGKFLYQGILKYGKENFYIELVEEGDFEYIRDREILESKNTMYQKNMGWNGNVGKAIFNDERTIETSILKRKNTIKNRTPKEWKNIKKKLSKSVIESLEKRAETISKKSKEEIENWHNSIRLSRLGKNKETSESVRKQAISMKNRYTAPTKKMIAGWKKISKTQTGKTKFNNLGTKRQSEKMLGRNTGKSNISWKGYWVTPKGKFETLKQAADSIHSKNLDGVKFLCLGKRSKFTKTLIKNYNLPMDYLGVSPLSVGFGFLTE